MTRDLRSDAWVEEIGEVLRALAESDVEELELEHEGARLLIRRDPTSARASGEAGISADRATIEPHVVTSPLVGVFRRSPGGGESPIEEGDLVTVGQAVGAVEAMRMPNRIQSERGGVVEKVLVQDGQPVEYGQPLLVLRTGGG